MKLNSINVGHVHTHTCAVCVLAFTDLVTAATPSQTPHTTNPANVITSTDVS